MSDKNPTIELSRRKTLAALGTIGAASAGAGLGTSAYFSDTETFEDNTLTAGALDLKVDWEEHYSDWSDDESAAVGGDVVMTNGDPDQVPDGYVGVPDPMHPLIAIPSEDLGAFMDATSIEAYPDDNNDGIQDQDDVGRPVFPNADSICNTDSDLPGVLGSDLRSQNADTGLPDDGGNPLVNLTDLKPGDFGELTLSFHLCDNPGYVWLQGAPVRAAENGVTEPEEKDNNESGPADEVATGQDVLTSQVELLDAIQTTMWYDDSGDNTITGGGATPAVELVLDASASMAQDNPSRNSQAIEGAKQLADAIIDAGGSVGVTFFSQTATDASTVQSIGSADATDKTATENAIDGLPASGDSTAIGNGIGQGDSDLANAPSGTRRVQVVVTDGENNAGTDPSTAADNAISSNTDEIFAIGTGGASTSSLEEFARPVDAAHVQFTTDLTNVIANLSQVIIGEKVFFRGTLREALTTLSSGLGIPLDGNRATDYTEVQSDGTPTNGANENRECFVNSVTQHVGVAWYLPVDHANEIQTDSVSFDLGFYTEQCRHNDGAGMPAQAD